MIKIYIDAAYNPRNNKSGGGIVIVNTDKKEQQQLKIALQAGDNHTAEFKVMDYILQELANQKLFNEMIMIHSDSKIVIQSIEKRYAQNDTFKDILAAILQKADQFSLLFFNWIAEKENRGADQLAKQALMLD
ncbi:ribonuclease HI family protein [Vagococcus silagei]|uniref:Ribonuclease HI family protein n=1 Tax=Vagococcus silagei TaxID=2508885 RepID=A0A4S3B008_9ENTE|nr:ribonuclease HI family protein [Vagococcus silagei]THB60082.1 ribonuclease HI family protein [Vagococcus silagei]